MVITGCVESAIAGCFCCARDERCMVGPGEKVVMGNDMEAGCVCVEVMGCVLGHTCWA